MWSCKWCDTINEESQSVCSLCGAHRIQPEPAVQQEKAEPQTGANYRYEKQSEPGGPRTGVSEKKPAKQNGVKVLVGVLAALLVVAVGVIVLLMSRTPTPAENSTSVAQQNAAQAPADNDSATAGNAAGTGMSAPATQTVCGDVTLTVESHCQYLANIIPASDPVDMAGMPESIYETDNFLFIVTACDIVTFMRPAIGDEQLAGATVQLVNLDTGDTREVISGADGACEKITGVVPGSYIYTVSLEGYEMYASNPFTVRPVSGEAGGPLGVICALKKEGSVFSENLTIQLTDLDGNPISNQTFGSMMLFTCQQSGQQFITMSGTFIGDKVDDQGMITASFFNDQPSLNSLLKGKMVLITFEGLTEWDANGAPDQYILIRAE